MSYAGDILSKEAYDLVLRDPAAQIVDVRSDAEWTFVGLPDLSAAGKKPVLLAWQTFPGMRPNPNFVAELSAALPDKAAPLLFLCRSGARSRHAAIAMTAAGYQRCFNIADGFEGGHDGERHRGQVNGWKAAGLPWAQA